MTEKLELTELERENQRNLRRLVLSMQASLGKLSLFVGICDNSQYRDAIVQTYERELQAKGVTCQRATIDRHLPSLKQALLDLQEREPLPSDTPQIVTVLGVDTLLSVRLGEPKSPQEKFFFSAQWTREGLRQFQFPVVLWVTEAIARSLAQLAPDFWSWRGGVFEFRQPIGYTLPSLVGTTEFDDSRESYSPESLANPTEIRQQIESLSAEDPNSPLLRSLYSSLGKTYSQRLEQGKATNYPQEQQHAIAAFHKAIDLAVEDDSELATDYSYLAGLYRAMGRYSEAEPLYVRSLSIREQQLGADHPSTATSLNNLALFYWAQGDTNRAIDFLNRGIAVEETNLTTNLVAGSERQKRQYLGTVSSTTDAAISLHLNAAPNTPQAARLATTVLLQRQGRILDVFTNSLQLLRQHSSDPEIGKLLDDYSATVTQRANLEYNPPEQLSPEADRTQLTALNNQIAQLEDQLSRRSSEFAIATQPATLETIQPLIPADAALVQLVRYQPFDPKAPQNESYGAPRYAAYILTRSGEPQGIDLGDAAAIDEAVESFRQVFKVQNAPPTPLDDVRAAARDLDKLLMQPVRQLLGNTRHLILAPDGVLNLIPFWERNWRCCLPAIQAWETSARAKASTACVVLWCWRVPRVKSSACGR